MSNTVSVTSLTFLSGVRQVYALHQRLTRLAEAAVAERELCNSDISQTQHSFRKLLHETINSIDITAPDAPRSVGLTWLSHGIHRVLFRQLVTDNLRATFFQEHLGNQYIVDMLAYRPLLELVLQDGREQFAIDVLSAWIPDTDTWVATLADAKVDGSVAANAIMSWLRHSPKITVASEFMARFLIQGAGPAVRIPCGDDCDLPWRLSHGHTLWTALNEHELTEALTLCALRMPEAFFDAPTDDDIPVSHKAKIRLGSVASSTVLQLAARNLCSAEGLSVKGLDCLSLNTKRQLARRLDGVSILFLVKLALDSDSGSSLFHAHIRHVVKAGANFRVDFLEAHRIMRTFESDGPHHRSATIIRMQETLCSLAATREVCVGVLESLPDGALGVKHDNVYFVDPDAVESDLKSGDRVVFDIPEEGITVRFYGF